MNKIEQISEITRAILNDEGSYQGHNLPKPQRSGTSLQNESYARQYAEKMYETHFSSAQILVDNSKFLEGASDLARKIVAAQFGGSETEEDENGDTVYTEEAQDFFNEVYDEVEFILNNKLGVFSDIN